jgi:hypothetical protein
VVFVPNAKTAPKYSFWSVYGNTVLGLHLSVGGATVLTVGFSATNQRVYDLAANQTIDLGATRWEGDPNAAFTAASSAAATVDSTMDYTTEVSPS